MSERDRIITAIGAHVVGCFETWTKDPVGRYLTVPVRLPLEKRTLLLGFPHLSDWMMRVEVSAPTLIETLGPGEYRHLSLEEALERIQDLGRRSRSKP